MNNNSKNDDDDDDDDDDNNNNNNNNNDNSNQNHVRLVLQIKDHERYSQKLPPLSSTFFHFSNISSDKCWELIIRNNQKNIFSMAIYMLI